MESIGQNILLLTSRLAPRSESKSTMSPTIQGLLIALVILFALSFTTVLAFLMVRRMRRSRALSREGLLPAHQRGDHLTITATPYGRTSTLYLYDEKSPMMSKKSCDMDGEDSHASDAVPEIRITFPDEQDESGRRKSGRVVVVRVGETSIGLEPLRDEEQLPAYEREGKWQSLDMERIGGLKEKSWA